MKTSDLSRHVPPGLSDQPIQALACFGTLASVAYVTWGFMWSFHDHAQFVFRDGTLKEALPGHMMVDFEELLGRSPLIFLVLILCFAAFLFRHYLYHRQDSRSDYTMRRLPNQWEYHRRCLLLPCCGILLSLLVAALLIWLLYTYYMTIIPEANRYPDQWQRLLDTWIPFWR